MIREAIRRDVYEVEDILSSCQHTKKQAACAGGNQDVVGPAPDLAPGAFSRFSPSRKQGFPCPRPGERKQESKGSQGRV